MLRSMTGFGGTALQIEGIHYAIEIRSVNGRYYKASIKLPEMWSHAEAQIDRMLRERLYRGSVTLVLRMRMEDAAAAYSVNLGALRRYVEQAQAALPPGASLEIGSLLLLPGVCQPPAADEIAERSWPALQAAVTQAVDQLLAMRRSEGEALYADLVAQCDAIARHLATVEARKDIVLADYHRRLANRVNELVNTASITVNQQDLVREVAVFAERSDINEEVSRLRGHLEQFCQVCRDEEQGGRKLDFIAQEMLREANTMGAKANDGEIARAIVEIKGSIDRIKEQVQNAE
jgi:uncharacterized protein (TIGR00255 family)